MLDATERQRWHAYRRAEDRDRFLVGVVLAKAAIGAARGVPAAAVTLDRSCTECGKPHGKPAAHGVELSVSHSGDLIAVALARKTPVGIDVEQVRETTDAGALARYVLADAELTRPLPAARFFVLWTRKEAVTKATGDGLRVPFRQVIVSGPDEPPRVLAWPYPDLPGTVSLYDLTPGPGYAAALAVLGDAGEVREDSGSALLAALATAR